MIIRVYETGDLDLHTVESMLWSADKQANFHPDAHWINSSSISEPEEDRRYREFYVKWIGREAIIMWLTSNQILYEIVSYALLPEEEDALIESLEMRDLAENHKHIN
tara:strand:- start:226 stop:546 length:321 start_codon:yes stop_codon:yes gene_type:complete